MNDWVIYYKFNGTTSWTIVQANHHIEAQKKFRLENPNYIEIIEVEIVDRDFISNDDEEELV